MGADSIAPEFVPVTDATLRMAICRRGVFRLCRCERPNPRLDKLLYKCGDLYGITTADTREIVTHITGALDRKPPGDHDRVVCPSHSNRRITSELNQRVRKIQCPLKKRTGASLEGFRRHRGGAAASAAAAILHEQ